MLLQTATRPAQAPAAPATDGTLDLMGASFRFECNAEIYGEEDPAEYVYRLVSGVVRTSRLLGNGRRQIGAFLLPGDVFGFEAGAAHRLAAEAVTDCTVLAFRRRALEAQAARDPEVARELFAQMLRDQAGPFGSKRI